MKASPLQGLHLHFDPVSGIAGDMTIAALVDAGVPQTVVTKAIAAMGVKGLQVAFEKRKRGAYAGTGFMVTWPGKKTTAPVHGHDHHEHNHHAHDHPPPRALRSPLHTHHHEHRDYAEIRRLLKRARLAPEIRELAGAVFARIAQVEARMHGVSLDRVAFHEVGAYDSIADIIGVAAALVWLAPVSVTSAPPVVGTGSVRTDHGLVAVPTPATAALLEDAPMRLEGEGELTTPTGAAILAAVVDAFAPPPPLLLRAQGFGAGTRELLDRPNVLRVLIGEPLGKALAPPPVEVMLVQANIDDMSPQLIEPLMTALFQAGALDVWVTPITMKKGRPAFEVSALAPSSALADVEQAYFHSSTTIGVRRAAINRTVLPRARLHVETSFGAVAVKLASLDGEVVNATPEFDDCRRLAVRAGVPVRVVIAEAAAAAGRLSPVQKKRRR